MALYQALMEAIPAYTGLSPSNFFTILALMVAAYRLVSTLFFVDAHDRRQAQQYIPPPPPVQLGDVTEEELRAYDGSDPDKPLLVAIKGQIYDVSRSRTFYGPGGPYALFAGRDASRALALMSFEPQDLTGNIEGLSPSELEALRDWEYTFMGKYVKVGQIVATKSASPETRIREEKETSAEDAHGDVKDAKECTENTAQRPHNSFIVRRESFERLLVVLIYKPCYIYVSACGVSTSCCCSKRTLVNGIPCLAFELFRMCLLTA